MSAVDWKAIGPVFRKLRQSVRPRLSQAQLARQVDVSAKTIERLENGEGVKETTLRALCSVLGVSFEDAAHKKLTGKEASYKAPHGEARGRYALKGEAGVVAFADAGSAPWYCPECGRQQEATYKFCPFDGTRKPPEVEHPEPARKVEPNVPEPTKPAVQGGRRRAKLEEGSDRPKTGTPQEAQQ
ncbi:MAG TPA: helix-turn-helix transcriptional regulator [Planctomycetota bacterium]|nr:helix-turn-helix transcriptional regulator [Planctomycetota bacterium]